MPTKTRKPRRTKNSASNSIMRLRLATNRIDCRRDRRWIRRAPSETLDDRPCGVPGDVGDVGHGVGAHLRDLALGVGELDCKLVLEGLSLGLRISCGCVTRGLGEALRLRARLGQCLL